MNFFLALQPYVLMAVANFVGDGGEAYTIPDEVPAVLFVLYKFNF